MCPIGTRLLETITSADPDDPQILSVDDAWGAGEGAGAAYSAGRPAGAIGVGIVGILYTRRLVPVTSWLN